MLFQVLYQILVSPFILAPLAISTPVLPNDLFSRQDHPRQLPEDAGGLKTIMAPNGVQIRYKELDICETAYSGYIDLDPRTHIFFWFIEARNDPAEKPVTMWLTGGPGSDSLLAAFIEHGPCWVTDEKGPRFNEYSWSNHSNMLYLSQPVGTGFSYSEHAAGSIDSVSGDFVPAFKAPATGIWPVQDASQVDTADLAAIAAWHTLQAFFANLPNFASNITTKSFNLWTESYGGRWGPIFFNYFVKQNEMINEGGEIGVKLEFDTLGVGNGIIDWKTQAEYYPRFATENTYGIKGVNETVKNFMNFANKMPGGCLDLIDFCHKTDMVSPNARVQCSEAEHVCRDMVEGPWYSFSGRGIYDIRASASEQVPPTFPLVTFLNSARIQNAFARGDTVLPSARKSLEELLDKEVRIILYYGDADYIGNWFGGEAVSMALNYKHANKFRTSSYAPFEINGKEYGAVRESGNFSFVRVYDSGHQVPFFQPFASQILFQRALEGVDISTGKIFVTGNYSTNGSASSTHTNAPLSN